MTTRTVTLVLLTVLLTVATAKADQTPFKKVKALDFELTYKGNDSAAVSAAASLPYVLIREGGGVYSLLDLENLESHLLADNAASEKLVSAADWVGNHVSLFFTYEGFVERINPESPSRPKDIPAEIQSAPLRHFTWLGEQEILIDGVKPYVMREGALTHMGEQNIHIPTQSGLVVVNEDRYVTSGYEDESLRLYSLPDGDLLNEWELGGWFSSRKITTIAVVNERLLVVSAGGRIEERSLDNGEVLWSARPCRAGPSFFHSSQQQSHNSDFRRTDSINVNDKIFYGCGDRFGTIHRNDEGWQVEPLHRTLNIEGKLTNVEMIPDTDLAVLVVAQDEAQAVYVVDHQKQAVLQQLENTQDYNPGPLTYVSATRQLVLVGESDELYLYDLNMTE